MAVDPVPVLALVGGPEAEVVVSTTAVVWTGLVMLPVVERVVWPVIAYVELVDPVMDDVLEDEDVEVDVVSK